MRNETQSSAPCCGRYDAHHCTSSRPAHDLPRFIRTWSGTRRAMQLSMQLHTIIYACTTDSQSETCKASGGEWLHLDLLEVRVPDFVDELIMQLQNQAG
jgi:hypothetical protein